ncbi:MAG: hypothetical protein RBS07_07790 [Lentimicrobium sp.]|jgi:uncharacterized membrane protein required for colicin V production|nr:hypothetical protein [Lentimicrobium sp.]
MQVILTILAVIGAVVLGSFILKGLGYFLLALFKGVYTSITHPAILFFCVALSVGALAILIRGDFSFWSVVIAGGMVGFVVGIARKWIARASG